MRARKRGSGEREGDKETIKGREREKTEDAKRDQNEEEIGWGSK